MCQSFRIYLSKWYEVCMICDNSDMYLEMLFYNMKYQMKNAFKKAKKEDKLVLLKLINWKWRYFNKYCY